MAGNWMAREQKDVLRASNASVDRNIEPVQKTTKAPSIAQAEAYASRFSTSACVLVARRTRRKPSQVTIRIPIYNPAPTKPLSASAILYVLVVNGPPCQLSPVLAYDLTRPTNADAENGMILGDLPPSLPTGEPALCAVVLFVFFDRKESLADLFSRHDGDKQRESDRHHRELQAVAAPEKEDRDANDQRDHGPARIRHQH